MRRPPTMADVAQVAGVSHQTVSRVLNGLPGVRPATAERVQQAIRELGYRRNLSARLLASSRSRMIGVVTYGTNQFGPQSIMLGLESAARLTGYRLASQTVEELSRAGVRAAVESLMELSVEAIVFVVPQETVVRDAVDAELGVPAVVVEGELTRMPLTAGVDNVRGAQLATGHLLDLGHPTVVHVAGPQGWNEAVARIDGWRRELIARQRPVPPLSWVGDWSARSGFEAGVSLARDPDVTAVFVANDQMALGLVAALRAGGRRVPGDVSVVGFDDLPEAAYFAPPLTTVRQDFAELGRRALALVERVLDGEEEAVAELVAPELVVRESTAPPRRGQ
ncbi:LacI family DNA-binding transcriptional regulator [Nocardioides dilutus]